MAPSSRIRIRRIRIDDVVKALEIVAERLGDAGSCDTLQAWARERRVTPSGQQLTPEAVEKGIEIWKVQKASAKRTAGTLPQTTTPADQNALDGKRQMSTGERRAEEAKLVEMTQRRFEEVLAEIQGHAEELLRRRSPEALEEFRSTAPGDRRELYTRIVHKEQEPDASPPESLQAELLSHQVEGLEWLASLYVNGLHGILADEMGLGKTIQSIALLLHLQERKQNAGPHLIVAPKSCLGNWQAEFQRFAPSVVVHVLVGDQESREAELSAFQRSLCGNKVVVCVTNYEQVHRNELLMKTGWQLVIVDEGHRLKNPETLLHTTMTKLRCRMRLLLTGTPLQNSISELWALLHYLLPDLFTNMLDFKAWFASPFKGSGMNEFDVQLNPEQEQEVCAQTHALLAPFLLQRLKAEVLGQRLPPHKEVTVTVPLSAWQESAYSDLEKKTLKLLGESVDVTNEQVNNVLMQLRKIVLHPYLFQQSYVKDADLFRTSGKVEALDRMLPKLLRFDHKVLIFSQFTSALDILQDYLEWKKIDFVRIDGQVPHVERLARLKRFEHEAVPVFLLSSRAGGLGLNLQAADTVVLFDLDWNPQNDKQAVARVHRVGQTREVRIVRLISESRVERHMAERCTAKLQMEQKILGAGMFRQATAEQRRGALRAVLGLEDGVAPQHSSEVKDPKDVQLTTPEELNRHLARSEQELKVFMDTDAELLRPRRLLPLELKDAPQLVRCGRLMRPSEVPDGFTGRAWD